VPINFCRVDTRPSLIRTKNQQKLSGRRVTAGTCASRPRKKREREEPFRGRGRKELAEKGAGKLVTLPDGRLGFLSTRLEFCCSVHRTRCCSVTRRFSAEAPATPRAPRRRTLLFFSSVSVKRSPKTSATLRRRRLEAARPRKPEIESQPDQIPRERGSDAASRSFQTFRARYSTSYSPINVRRDASGRK